MSREIDALIAEHVMGYTPDEKKYNFKSDIEWFCIDDWSPSIYIADAWEVVEKFNFILLTTAITTKYMCKLGIERKSVFANTAPMAICLAALRAKNIEVPK